MAHYKFPNVFKNEISDPVVNVYACTDNWNGTCSVQIRLVTPFSTQVFMFPNSFTYTGDSPTHEEVEAWVVLEVAQYEV